MELKEDQVVLILQGSIIYIKTLILWIQNLFFIMEI